MPIISSEQGTLLNFIIKNCNARNVLEIWSCTWYSTIWLWEAAKYNKWRLLSYERQLSMYIQAKENVYKAWLSEVVTLKNCDFLSSDISSCWDFDFVFVDGQMSQYLDYFKKIENQLSKNAIIVFDNTKLFRHKMSDLFEYLKNKRKFIYFDMEIHDRKWDWITILRKKLAFE